MCMGGSANPYKTATVGLSAPRVHGWFLFDVAGGVGLDVCPACAWVVPDAVGTERRPGGLLRVCMGGSLFFSLSFRVK